MHTRPAASTHTDTRPSDGAHLARRPHPCSAHRGPQWTPLPAWLPGVFLGACLLATVLVVVRVTLAQAGGVAALLRACQQGLSPFVNATPKHWGALSAAVGRGWLLWTHPWDSSGGSGSTGTGRGVRHAQPSPSEQQLRKWLVCREAPAGARPGPGGPVPLAAVGVRAGGDSKGSSPRMPGAGEDARPWPRGVARKLM